MNNATYFSENALLPGMVDTEYMVHHTTRALQKEVENLSRNSKYVLHKSLSQLPALHVT